MFLWIVATKYYVRFAKINGHSTKSCVNQLKGNNHMNDYERNGQWFAVCHRAYDAVYWGPFDSIEAGHKWADDHKIDFGIGFVQMNEPESPESSWWF